MNISTGARFLCIIIGLFSPDAEPDAGLDVGLDLGAGAGLDLLGRGFRGADDEDGEVCGALRGADEDDDEFEAEVGGAARGFWIRAEMRSEGLVVGFEGGGEGRGRET